MAYSGECPAHNQSSGQTILCVEDNQAYLRLRKAVLEREGYLVLTATTGKEALAILRQERICLVLSDHMLRGTTGVALAGRLKKLKPHIFDSGASTRKMQLGTHASVAPPKAWPITIVGREIGATNTLCRKPSRRSSTVEIVAKIAVKSSTSVMKPGYRYSK